MKTVFDFSDYKAFLKATEQSRTGIERGFRSRLAEALDCQNAYISQVLNTHAHFSLEQALKISEFLGLNEVSTRYFLLLVEQARAGTPALKAYFEKDIQRVREEHLNIKSRVPGARFLTVEEQSVYHSSWLYSTIHILVTIPHYQSMDKIVSALRIEEHVVKNVLLFLISVDLISEEKGKLRPGSTQVHLSKDSPNIRQHHTNWRIRAIQSFASIEAEDLHYSTVSSLSLADAKVLHGRFVQIIDDYLKTIAPSTEETLYNFNLDFYSILKK